MKNVTLYRIITYCWIIIGLTTTGQAQNLALNKATFTSGDYNGSYGGNKAVDGITSVSSKWTSADRDGFHWIFVDLGQSHPIRNITVKHAGAAGEPAYFNTQAYQIRYYTGTTWVTATTVNNSSQQNITNTQVLFSTRYVMIYVTDPGVDRIARIPEIEVYSSGSAVLNSSGDSHLAWPYVNSQINCSNRLAGTGGWYVTCSTGCGAHKNSDYYADDWVTSQGTLNQAMYSPIAGTVIYAAQAVSGSGGDPAYGKQVIVRSSQNNTFAFRVAHLNTISVSVGQVVSEGTLLGKIGSTGNSTGPHAHTVLYRNLNQAAINKLNLGGYLVSSSYAAPFYFDAACPNNQRVSGATKAQAIATREEILEGLRGIDQQQNLALFPNPMVTKAMARFTLSTEEVVSLAIYDLSGKMIQNIINSERKQAGEIQVEIDASQLKGGWYVLQLKTPSLQKAIKLKIVK